MSQNRLTLKFHFRRSGRMLLEFPQYWRIYAEGAPEPVPEYVFAPGRRFRFDYAWPAQRMALEIEGGVFARKGARKCPYCGQIPQGRHAGGQGYVNDCIKYNLATQRGWRVFRVTPKMLHQNPRKIVLLLRVALGENHAQK